MDITEIDYPPYGQAYCVTNDVVDLVFSPQFGPRILHFGFCGGENQFGLLPSALETALGMWKLYGGHRLWAAPEKMPETYAPDNGPVEWSTVNGEVIIRGGIEGATSLQKEIAIQFLGAGNGLRVTHRVYNRGEEAAEFAPWALSVMATGGEAIVPMQIAEGSPQSLTASGALVYWPYTDFSDARWKLGHQYLRLRQDSAYTFAQKAGVTVPAGWAAHWRDRTLFVKKYQPVPAGFYTDHGALVEVYTNAYMLELETLGPFASIAPGASVEHVEEWSLYANIPVMEAEADLNRTFTRLGLRG